MVFQIWCDPAKTAGVENVLTRNVITKNVLTEN
jgi:hypothetical protein